MTSTLQQVADDLASRLGEMRVVMDELRRALLGASACLDLAVPIVRHDACKFEVARSFEDQIRVCARALSAYERMRKLYSETTGDAS